MSEELRLRQASAEVEVVIKQALLKRHMKQKDLAKLLKTSPQWINRAVKGQNTPKANEIRKEIYQVLNIQEI